MSSLFWIICPLGVKYLVSHTEPQNWRSLSDERRNVFTQDWSPGAFYLTHRDQDDLDDWEPSQTYALCTFLKMGLQRNHLTQMTFTLVSLKKGNYGHFIKLISIKKIIERKIKSWGNKGQEYINFLPRDKVFVCYYQQGILFLTYKANLSRPALMIQGTMMSGAVHPRQMGLRWASRQSAVQRLLWRWRTRTCVHFPEGHLDSTLVNAWWPDLYPWDAVRLSPKMRHSSILMGPNHAQEER